MGIQFSLEMPDVSAGFKDTLILSLVERVDVVIEMIPDVAPERKG